MIRLKLQSWLKGRSVLPIALAVALSGVAACDSGSVTDAFRLLQTTLTPKVATISVGQTVAFQARAHYNDGSARDVPATYAATGGTITPNGIFTGTAPGIYTITASLSTGDVLTATVTVVSGPAPVSLRRLTLSPDTVRLQTGQSAQFQIAGLFSNDSTGPVTAQFFSQGGTVGSSGFFIAGPVGGTFPVIASSNGVADTAWAIVTAGAPPAVALVVIAPQNPTVVTGGSVQLTANILDSSGNFLTGRAVTWTSSNQNVAVVNASGLVTAIAPGGATITAISEGVVGATQVTVSAPASTVASVVVTPGSASVQVGGTTTLSAAVLGANGAPLAGKTVTWSSSNGAVASVSGSGVVTGVAAGTATITATSDGKSGSSLITVTTSAPPPPPPPPTQAPVATVAVSPASAAIRVGGAVNLSAIARDSAGAILTGRPVTWATSNAAVASVSSTGVVTGISAGNATITATSEGKSGTAQVAVSVVPVATVTVSPTTASVQTGATTTLTATTRDSAGATLTGRAIAWSSSNTAVATVSSAGVVTGVAAGSATITATSEGRSGTAQVTVTAAAPAPVATVTVSPTSASIQTGSTQQLSAVTRDANNNVLTGRTITWSSSNSAVATVSSSGLVTGISAGSATITATSETRTATSAITVTAPAPPPPPGTASCEAPAGNKCVHISLGGSDGNAGTYSAPYATFAKAHSVVVAGDYIYYLSGVYTNDNAHFIQYDKNLSSGQSITIKPHPGHTVVFDNQGRDGSLAVIGGRGAIVEGFEFRNSHFGGPAGALNGWTQGIGIWGTYTHFRRNYVHNITGSASGNGGSLRIQNTTNNQVYNNYFHDLKIGGTGAKANVNHVIVMDAANNQVYGNYFSGSAAGCFLQKHNPHAGNQSTLYNNTFVGCQIHGSNGEGYGWTIRNNLYINSQMAFNYAGASNYTFEYNTVYYTGPTLVPGNGAPIAFRRNILYQAGGMGSGTEVTMRFSPYLSSTEYSTARSSDAIDYNCYFNAGGSVRISYFAQASGQTSYTLAQFRSSIGKDLNSIEANPQFVSAGTDFHTQAGSPCSAMGAYANGGNPPSSPAAALGRNP